MLSMNKSNRIKRKEVRYTKDEIILIDKIVSKSSFSNYSDYVRFYSLSKFDNVNVKAEKNNNDELLEIRNLVVAVNRLNNNLNQIAKQVNTHTDKIDKTKFEILSAINVIKEDSNILKNEFLK
jgi:hypothetical protein